MSDTQEEYKKYRVRKEKTFGEERFVMQKLSRQSA